MANEQEKLSTSKIDPITIWLKQVIDGPGGFKVWEDRECVLHMINREVSIAGFVIRCLANPDCEGSEDVLNAIIKRRDEQL